MTSESTVRTLGGHKMEERRESLLRYGTVENATLFSLMIYQQAIDIFRDFQIKAEAVIRNARA